MCELLGMSALLPTTLRLSMNELARHGGDTGPHTDGWGIALLQHRDALVVREPVPAFESRLLDRLLFDEHARSTGVIAHIRKATRGERMLRNTQPFQRELGGRILVFAHNGMVHGIERDDRFPTRRFRPVGDTDSEHAFCALLDRLAPLWETDVPSLDARLEILGEAARELRSLGPANFLYSDGDAVFAHADRRHHDDGLIRAPGLHVLCRTCTPQADDLPLAGLSLPHLQQVALVASVPLSVEVWEPLATGTIVVLQDGRVRQRLAT